MGFPDKDNLKKMLTKNKQKEVLQVLVDYTATVKDTELNSDALLVTTAFNHLEQNQRIGTNSYDQQILERSKLNKSLLGIVNLLPDDLNAVVEGKTEPPPKGVSEQKIMQLLTRGIIVSKVAPLILLVLMGKGSFTSQQMFAVFAFFLPVFLLFFPKFFQQNLHKENILLQTNYRTRRWFKPTFRNFIWKGFIVYTLILLAVIAIRPLAYPFEIMLVFLGIIESGFGLYLTKILEWLTL